jgi:hypothetical protein
VVLQWCYSGVTVVLERSYSVVTVVYGTGADAAGRGGRRGDVRVGAEVDVQQSRVGALGKN